MVRINCACDACIGLIEIELQSLPIRHHLAGDGALLKCVRMHTAEAFGGEGSGRIVCTQVGFASMLLIESYIKNGPLFA